MGIKKDVLADHTHCFLCEHALPEWQEAIMNHAAIRHFKRGQEIFREGEPVTGIYFLHTGNVKVHKQWGTEKELIVKIAARGDVIGHRGMGKQQYYPVAATALDQVSACFVSTAFLQTTLRVNNELTYQLMLYYANELQEAEQGMRNLVHMEVKGRIAAMLLKIESLFGTDGEGYINPVLTRQDMASFAGTIYETLFKVFNELHKEGIVLVAGKQIAIKNRKALGALLEVG